LDGDTAGLRAAMRVIDIALPLLEAGKSLRFALMPEGMDPDDLIKKQGASAMQALLDQAIPMVQLLWQREIEGKSFDSPERKAALDKALREKIKLIVDPSIRSHYGEAIKDLRWQLFRPQKRSGAGRGPIGGRDGWRNKPHLPVASSRSSGLATGTTQADHMREAVILATLVGTPAAIDPYAAQIERMECADPDHAALRDALLRHADADDVKAAIIAEIGDAALEKLMAQSHLRVIPAVRRAGDIETAGHLLDEELSKLAAQRGHVRELRDGMEENQGQADESLTWRLSQAAAAIDTSMRKDDDDSLDFEKADNGSLLNKDERSAFDRLLGGIQIDKSSVE